MLTHKNPVTRQLCNAMKKIGYKNVQETGCLGDIVVRPPNRVNIEEYFTEKEMDLSWKVVAQ